MSEVETNPTPTGADVDPLDQIADLLVEDPEKQPDTAETQVDAKAGDAGPDGDPDTPTADDDATVADAQVVDGDDGDGDDDRTLSQMMGLADDQVNINEETGEMSLRTKVDGVEETVNLKEVLAGYQTSKYNTQKSMALAEDRKTFEAAAGKKAGEIKQVLELNSALTQRLQSELLREFQSTNWDELRQTDPAEYAARQQDQSVRYNQLQQIQQQVQQQYGQADQQQQQQNNTNMQAELANQRQVMMDNNPTWHDQAVMKTEVAEIRTFLADTYGLSEADISVISDAKAIHIIQDAMAFRKGAPVAKQRIAAVPKMQKSRGVKPKKVSKLDRLTKAARSATGAQKRDLQTDAIAELLSGG
ncbi:hypothetical protein DRQ25_10795 [Candidatus Fermentibacteria bacterium]|nr:MAG: hypothetical protein DRQ25_10795 [Candidatus Fermentibacteria bacterium]